MSPTITAQMAEFVAGLAIEDIPEPVMARGRIHILDCLGLALAGQKAPASAMLRDQLAEEGTVGDATVFGTAIRTSPRWAALINGTAMHVDNFDDTNPQSSPERNGGIHASAPVLAATLAAAEKLGAGGGHVLAAFHAGVEASCKLSQAMGARHYGDGFHTTGTLNAFGAAAAVARLRDMDAAKVEHALAGAASRAAGLRANFGSMVEQLHTGTAAEAGLMAADLASRGLTGAPAILETPLGWFAAAGGFEVDAIDGTLGNPWAFNDPGMWIKPFPSGALTHPAVTLMLELIAKHDFIAEDVAHVRVLTNSRIRATLIHDRPTDVMQARFSMPFCLGVTLLEGRVGLGEFTDEAIASADVKALMERIEFAAYNQVEEGFTNVTSFLEIELRDGTRHKGRADYGLGSTKKTMDHNAVADKFLGCADYAGWPRETAERIIETVGHMEDLPNMGGLTELLAKRR